MKKPPTPSKSFLKKSEVLRKYLADIRAFDQLSLEDEERLGKECKTNSRARDELVEHNLPFVVWVAKRYANNGCEIDDLINEGNIGLIKAAETFDYTKGFRFVSHAFSHVRGHILGHLKEHSRIIRVPANVGTALMQINKALQRLNCTVDEAEAEDIALVSNIPIEKVTEYLVVYKKHLSLDTPLNEETERTRHDIFANKDEVSVEELVTQTLFPEYFETMLASLENDERFVFLKHQGIDMWCGWGFEEIAQALGISCSKAHVLYHRSLEKLRNKYPETTKDLLQFAA